MIVVDTSAIIALIDGDEVHHDAMVALYEDTSTDWVLPWAVLPEIDYLLMKRAGELVQLAFLRDVAEGLYTVEWGSLRDAVRARELCEKYRGLSAGLVDATVMAIAERLKAKAIATLDLRHFSAVELKGQPKLFPRDF